MKKLLMVILFVLFSSSIFSQDIVYDSIRGDRNYWFRIKAGQTEQITLGLMYENQGMLSHSKVLSGAGILGDMIKGIDYKDYTFPYDTLTYEFNTKDPVNLLVYQYHYNDTLSHYFVGIRKAELGAPTLEGQYLFIIPLIAIDSKVKIYEGIGSNRELFMQFDQSQMTESSLNEYFLSRTVTIQGINVSRVVRSSKTQDYVTEVDKEFEKHVKVWPNPTDDVLHIEMENPEKVIIVIFDMRPSKIYQQESLSNYHDIDFSNYKYGSYILMIANQFGIILFTTKIIKI